MVAFNGMINGHDQWAAPAALPEGLAAWGRMNRLAAFQIALGDDGLLHLMQAAQVSRLSRAKETTRQHERRRLS